MGAREKYIWFTIKSNFTEILFYLGISKCMKVPSQTGHHIPGCGSSKISTTEAIQEKVREKYIFLYNEVTLGGFLLESSMTSTFVMNAVVRIAMLNSFSYWLATKLHTHPVGLNQQPYPSPILVGGRSARGLEVPCLTSYIIL